MESSAVTAPPEAAAAALAAVDDHRAFDGQTPLEQGLRPGAALPQPSVLPFDAWREMVAGFFSLAGGALGLKSLTAARENPAFPSAAKAFYDTCEEVPALHFLIAPGNKWFGRAMAIGAFAVPTLGAVAAEVKARRAATKAVKAGPVPMGGMHAGANPPDDKAAAMLQPMPSAAAMGVLS